MNHISLTLGAIAIFVLGGLGYIVIPDKIEQANTPSTMTDASDADESEVSERNQSQSETLAIDATNEYDDVSAEYAYEAEVEYESEDNKTASQVPQELPPPTQTDPVETPPVASQPTNNGYTLAQVSEHSTESSCWTAVDGSVYDLTPFIKKHPGGKANIMKICGIDGTKAFDSQHGGDRRPENTLEDYYLGPLTN